MVFSIMAKKKREEKTHDGWNLMGISSNKTINNWRKGDAPGTWNIHL